MKKLLILIITCTLASIFFSSCKQGFSVMKRHYTDGYYVSHSGKKQTPAPQEKKETIALSKTKLPVYDHRDAKDAGQVPVLGKQNEKIASEPVTASTENMNPEKNKVHKQKANTSSQLFPEKKTIHFYGIPDLRKIANGSTHRDSLSFFWIIILIILIIWALGFGLGVGDIIHLLLIVALVLLILWLLRLI